MYRAEIVSAARGTKSIRYVHCVSGLTCGGGVRCVSPVSTRQSPFAATEAAGHPALGPISTVERLFCPRRDPKYCNRRFEFGVLAAVSAATPLAVGTRIVPGAALP